MNSIEKLRARLNEILQEDDFLEFSSDKQTLIKKLSITTTEKNLPLYAWTPAITLICTGTAGKTSDSCSSMCGVSGCSRKNRDSDIDDIADETPPPIDRPTRRNFKENGLGANPF